MDPLYQALSYYRRRKFEKCVDKCSEILKYNALDQVSENFYILSFSVYDTLWPNFVLKPFLLQFLLKE